jgi:hypothetical protein
MADDIIITLLWQLVESLNVLQGVRRLWLLNSPDTQNKRIRILNLSIFICEVSLYSVKGLKKV